LHDPPNRNAASALAYRLKGNPDDSDERRDLARRHLAGSDVFILAYLFV
jgi:hypothetical protein